MDMDYHTIYELALPFLDTRENKEHTLISYKFAARLLKEEGGDPSVVFPAVILHDVGWKSIPENLQVSAFGPGERDIELNRLHEIEGARIAGEIFKKVGYAPHLVEEIIEIILGHDSIKEATSINDAIVKDSDKLWRFTEHGVRVNTKRFSTPSLSLNLDRLRNRIDEWFLTATGIKLAKKELALRRKKLELGTF